MLRLPSTASFWSGRRIVLTGEKVLGGAFHCSGGVQLSSSSVPIQLFPPERSDSDRPPSGNPAAGWLLAVVDSFANTHKALTLLSRTHSSSLTQKTRGR